MATRGFGRRVFTAEGILVVAPCACSQSDLRASWPDSGAASKRLRSRLQE